MASPDMPQTLTLHNCAISTSGDTEQFVEIGGQRYSHVVDPHTGIGLTWLPKPAAVSLRSRPTRGASAALRPFAPTPTPVAAGLRKPRAVSTTDFLLPHCRGMTASVGARERFCDAFAVDTPHVGTHPDGPGRVVA